MRKRFFYILSALTLLFAYAPVHAQYYITSDTLYSYPDTTCVGHNFEVRTNAYTTGLTCVTYFGDGSSATNTIYNSVGTGYAYFTHAYTYPGSFTVKHVLLNAGAPVDSFVSSKSQLACEHIGMVFYLDANGDCMYDTLTEPAVTTPSTIEVRRNGTVVDTLTALSGFFYTITGAVGDIFAFKIISTSPGVTISCPASVILYDTVSSIVNAYHSKAFAVQCSGGTAYDMALTGTVRTGRHSYMSDVYVTNSSCTPHSTTLTMHASPKYDYSTATPAPTSISGTTYTWVLPAVSLISPAHVSIHFEQPTWLTPGDTVHTAFSITHDPSELDTTNNDIIRVDTVTGSFDPNDKSVYPTGNIVAGARLTYNIRFENTGNDTAFNVHIMDTLSAKVDPATLRLAFTSAPVNIQIIPYGATSILRFDFPNINLLDSAHHDDNHGMVSFSIQSKPTLPFGDVITNRAGIFFDYNDVVMTNTAYSTIGTPESVIDLSNAPRFAISPNPTHGTLIIHTDPAQYSSATITTISGQVVSTSLLRAVETTINTSTLPGGMYLITLTGKSGTTTQRFVKE